MESTITIHWSYFCSSNPEHCKFARGPGFRHFVEDILKANGWYSSKYRWPIDCIVSCWCVSFGLCLSVSTVNLWQPSSIWCRVSLYIKCRGCLVWKCLSPSVAKHYMLKPQENGQRRSHLIYNSCHVLDEWRFQCTCFLYGPCKSHPVQYFSGSRNVENICRSAWQPDLLTWGNYWQGGWNQESLECSPVRSNKLWPNLPAKVCGRHVCVSLASRIGSTKAC